MALPPSPVSSENSTPPPPLHTNGTTNEHYINPSPTSPFTRKSRKATKSSLQAYSPWEQPGQTRGPYHNYVHSLVQAGWDKLKPLDAYLCTDVEDQDLIISVFDISDDYQLKRWPDIHDEVVLAKFLAEQTRARVKVRLYLAEQRGNLAAGVMEALGSALDLDPRFFQWSVSGNKHILSASEHHRAPYVSVGFGVPKVETASRTDAENFKVSVYIQPDAVGDGWTGILLFSSHSKIELSSHNINPPPLFTSPRPTPITPKPASFRSLYLETFAYLDLAQATLSPFYAISPLLRLNCFCWGNVINSIRDEDRRINGISDTTVGHSEEIQKSRALVQRGGSLSWPGGEGKLAAEARQALEEDFKHLVEQTDLLWQNRDRMASIRQHKSETRWTTLTNSFTYVFAPITIMSGIYGMNVAQISGSSSNPNIWQFFVAVVALNVLVLMILALSNWVHIMTKHGRRAGAKEVFGFAVGKVAR